MACTRKRPDAVGDFPLGSPILYPVFLCAMHAYWFITGVLHLCLQRISFHVKLWKLSSGRHGLRVVIPGLTIFDDSYELPILQVFWVSWYVNHTPFPMKFLFPSGLFSSLNHFCFLFCRRISNSKLKALIFQQCSFKICNPLNIHDTYGAKGTFWSTTHHWYTKNNSFYDYFKDEHAGQSAAIYPRTNLSWSWHSVTNGLVCNNVTHAEQSNIRWKLILLPLLKINSALGTITFW
jgi:hypothetical protein